MSNPGNSSERKELLKLLDRLAAVDRQAAGHRKFLPDLLVDQWLHGDAGARRKIEEAIDHLPKKSS
jgi:hypothetical protein